MRISFSTAGLYPRTSMDALKLLVKAGYKEAELMPQCFRETGIDFAKQVRDIDIKVSSIHFPLVFFPVMYNPYAGILSEARTLVDNIVAAGYEMGTEVIVIHPLAPYSHKYAEEFDRNIIDNLRYICEKGMGSGIKVVLENNPRGGKTPGELSGMAGRINHQNMDLMLDITEAMESGEDPLDFIIQNHPVHLHLSDYSEKSKHLPVGEGVVKWDEIFSQLKAQDYEGIYVIEPSYRYYIDDAYEKLKQAKSFLEDLFGGI